MHISNIQKRTRRQRGVWVMFALGLKGKVKSVIRQWQWQQYGSGKEREQHEELMVESMRKTFDKLPTNLLLI